MKRSVKAFIVFLLMFVATVTGNYLQAQQPRFYDEIQAFKKQDSLQPPPKNAILFVGSSSFRFWKDVQDDFPGHTIINRGFGGSTLPEVFEYAGDIIFPYSPKQVVIYCGENDLAASDTVTAVTVAQRFQALFQLIRSRLPKTSIVFVSIKPSPSRAHLMEEMQLANRMIKNFLRTKRKTAYVDVYHKMLTENASPMKDIFVEDNLHMNRKGYAIWKKEIEPFLEKRKM